MSSRRPCISLAALIALAGCSMSPPSSVDDLVERVRGGGGQVTPVAPEPVPVPAGTPEAPRPLEVEQPKPAPSAPPAPAPAPSTPAPAAADDSRRHPLRLPIGLGEIDPAPARPRAQTVSPGLGLADVPGSRVGEARSRRLGVGEAAPIPVSGRSVAISVGPARPLPTSGVSLAALDPAAGPSLAEPSARRSPIKLGSAELLSSASAGSPGISVGEAASVRVTPVTSTLLQPGDASHRDIGPRSEPLGLPSPAQVTTRAVEPAASPRLPEPGAGPASVAGPPEVKAPYKGRVLPVVTTEATFSEVNVDAQVSIRVTKATDKRTAPAAGVVNLAAPAAKSVSVAGCAPPGTPPALGELPDEQTVRRQPEDRRGDASGLSRWLRDHFPFLF